MHSCNVVVVVSAFYLDGAIAAAAATGTATATARATANARDTDTIVSELGFLCGYTLHLFSLA